MENSQSTITVQHRLNFYALLKESLKIPFKNPSFIIFTTLTTLPLFSFMTVHEFALQRAFLRTWRILTRPNDGDSTFWFGFSTFEDLQGLLGEVCIEFLVLGVLYVCVLHFLNLGSLIATVDTASIIYKGEKAMRLSEMFDRLVKLTRIKGPIFTSVYVFLLSSLVTLGLISLSMYCYTTSPFKLFMVLFTIMTSTLFTKYVDWSVVWSMALVISVLEEKPSDVALVVSSYLRRFNRSCGILLVVIFFAWRLALRSISCLLLGKIGIKVVILEVGFICLANTFQWMMFVVYFYDCKKRSLEKKIDVVEESTVIDI